MSNVIIQPQTTKYPITLIGEEAGICWGADVNDDEKNYRRGLDCIKSGHGRTMEYPQIYMILDGYSARVMRELYTHIGGAPTRLQASSRYIDYGEVYEFGFVIPPSISADEQRTATYKNVMSNILSGIKKLDSLGAPREDVAMLLPLGMTTKVVLRTNLRNLIDMSHQRLCSRAYWEFRDLMRDIYNALINYGKSEFYQPTPNEWKEVLDLCYKPKCEVCGFCTEKKSCGHMPKKED